LAAAVRQAHIQIQVQKVRILFSAQLRQLVVVAALMAAHQIQTVVQVVVRHTLAQRV
jgi:hypothetical protein